MSAADGNVMWGTTAIHVLGDISRPDGDFFWCEGEDGDDWIGQWQTGLGFVEVRFPKATSRPITNEEAEWLSKRRVVVS